MWITLTTGGLRRWRLLPFLSDTLEHPNMTTESPIVPRIRTLAAEGRTAVQIAGELAVSTAHIYSLSKKHGITLPNGHKPYIRPPLTQTVRRAIVREANRQGCGVAVVLERLNAHVWAGDVATMGGGE